MHAVRRPSGRHHRVATAVGVLVAALGFAACGSGESRSAQPAGLSGQQAQSFVNAQFSAEDLAAKSVLVPKPGSFLAGKTTVTLLGSTTPSNGDENPYAIWPVTKTIGSVTEGDVLVDNFNNRSNDQGTGTTIVNVHPNGTTTVFASLPRTVAGCPGGVGLTTAMVQLETGWVIVGSLPSSNGQTATAGAGCLLVLSPTGRLAGTVTGSYLDGPWDMTVQDTGTKATLFVTNTLIGLTPTTTTAVNKGNVVRLTLSESAATAPAVLAETEVASGFGEHSDPSAFVRGPTGLALGADGTLYVADNLGNRIAAVPDALTRSTSAGVGTTVTSGGQLANPLGLVLAPTGDLLAANATNGKIVELTTAGQQVGEYFADQNVGQDPPGNGDLFDVAINQAGNGVLLVNDGTNTLELLH
jgi:hypothetical protein